jgi:DNA repair exonuclease SbcCD ATPase subunit
MQNAINQQNQVIADLTAGGNTTKAQYQEAVTKLAELNADLTTAHDKIKDLEAHQGGGIDQITKDQISETNSVVKSIRDFLSRIFK